jgi:hypothetical protein
VRKDIQSPSLSLLVVDSTSLGREGGLRWTYTGHSKINVTTQFNPTDVVTTTAEHNIVCDSSTHTLHVLSGQGDILTYKVMKDLGIEYPFSLAFDMRGQLWVGCITGGKQLKVFHYFICQYISLSR